MIGSDITMAEWENLLSRKEIVFSYRNWKGVVGERKVKPLNLFYKVGDQRFYDEEKHWFLVAYDIHKQELREFKLDNISFSLKNLVGENK